MRQNNYFIITMGHLLSNFFGSYFKEANEQMTDAEAAITIEQFYDQVNNLYKRCPKALMPLLLFTLARRDELSIVKSGSVKTNAFRSIPLDDLLDCEWVKNNPALFENFTNLKTGQQVEALTIELKLNTVTSDIYRVLRDYDDYTLPEEHYFPQGNLLHHTSKYHSNKLRADFEIFCFAQSALSLKLDGAAEFTEVFNHILCSSGLQPKRSRLEIARVLHALLADRTSTQVYYPFAGVGLVGALMGAGANIITDANPNPKFLAAGRLLYYGISGECLQFEQHDSRSWRSDMLIETVVSTYRGYIGNQPCLSYCLGKWRGTWAEDSVLAGVVRSSDFAENPHPEIRKAIHDDLLDTIVLTPYNEAVLLFRRKKENRGKIRLFNCVHTVFDMLDPLSLINGEGDTQPIDIPTAELISNDCKLSSHIQKELPELAGSRKVCLRDYLKPVEKRFVDVKLIDERYRAELEIDDTPFNALPKEYMAGLKKTPFISLPEPACYLTNVAIVIRQYGPLEPRVFSPVQGSVYLQNGLAFECKEDISLLPFIIDEMPKDYVKDQLLPYGSDELLNNEVTYEQILNLKIYIPAEEPDSYGELQILKCGDIISDNEHQMEYRILRHLGGGGFGQTYCAEQIDLLCGKQQIVALKEFFMCGIMNRDNGYISYPPHFEDEYIRYRAEFRHEAELLVELGADPNSHIEQAFSFFDCESTRTSYYAMHYYPNGDFNSELCRGLLTEQDAIHRVLIPVCKALTILHGRHMLHLDIKPQNLLVDEQGCAVLADFGLVKEYDENGNECFQFNPNGTQTFRAPEQCINGGRSMITWNPSADIYALAATLYYMTTGCIPHFVIEHSDQDQDLRYYMQAYGCSDFFASAVCAGLSLSSSARPQTPKDFLNLFPGCETIEL